MTFQRKETQHTLLVLPEELRLSNRWHLTGESAASVREAENHLFQCLATPGLDAFNQRTAAKDGLEAALALLPDVVDVTSRRQQVDALARTLIEHIFAQRRGTAEAAYR